MNQHAVQRGKGRNPPVPTREERRFLERGLSQPGRKLPLFDADGQPVRPELIRACIARGWAERWFSNPLAPEWLVCRLTDRGARVAVGPARGRGADRDVLPPSRLA
jgi:hypothetical protein